MTVFTTKLQCITDLARDYLDGKVEVPRGIFDCFTVNSIGIKGPITN